MKNILNFYGKTPGKRRRDYHGFLVFSLTQRQVCPGVFFRTNHDLDRVIDQNSSQDRISSRLQRSVG